jgi:hypothetical protein
MTSMQCKSVVRAAHYRQGAARLAIVAAAILLSACGVISNRKPIAPGTPVAHVHFGPVSGGFRVVSFAVRDGAACHPDQFKKGAVIGSYLGSDHEMDIPAKTKLFFIVGDQEGLGTTVVTCGGTVAFTPEEGAQYTVNLERSAKQCRIAVQKDSNSGKVEVATEVVPGTCLY